MKSIKFKLIILLILGITAIIGISGFRSYKENSRQDETDYQAQRGALQKRLALSLPQGAWEMDERSLRQTLDAELGWPSLEAISITGDGGLNLGRIKDQGHIRDMRPDETVHADDKAAIPIVYQSTKKLGVATAYLSRAELVHKQQVRLVDIIVQVVASGGLILILMTWALRHFVFRPLAGLRDALDLLASSNDVRTAKLKTGQEDEFGAVIRSFNAIVERIQDDIAQLTVAEKAAKEEQLKAEESYRKLLEAQQTLVETEKLASLGALVAGVAHEINTPLGITLTTASQLEHSTRLIEGKLQDGAIRKSDFLSYMETVRESCDLILSNSERAANLIQSFKRVSVDQTSEARRDFELADYLQEIITSLQPKLRRTRVRVDIECLPGIALDSYPGALSQVITNLVINALVHAFENHAAGVIAIRAHQLPDRRVSLVIADNGCGIPPAFMNRIFEPFFTTKRGNGGSGLGLHIVYNIVRQQLAGCIEVQSTMGEGTVFSLIIPNTVPLPFDKEQA